MAILEHARPLAATGLPQARQIRTEMTAYVVRAAFVPDDVERVGETAPLELCVGPGREPAGAVARDRVRGRCEIVRLVRIRRHIEQHLVVPMPVVAVVPRPQIEVVTPAHAALARPRALREYELVATCAPDVDGLAVPCAGDL